MKELALNHLPELAPRTVESLNLLRLRLEQTAPDAKIILLTSTTPQEGKTTLALQFWQLLAGLGQRCLLVDGDLRHSGIGRQCGGVSGCRCFFGGGCCGLGTDADSFGPGAGGIGPGAFA